MSLWYSSIDEVYPDFNSKKKKKKYNDPICDLYNSRNSNNSLRNSTNPAGYNQPQWDKAMSKNPDNKVGFEAPTVQPQQATSLPQKTTNWVEPEDNRYDISMGAPIKSSEFEKQFQISQPMQQNEYSDDDVKKIMNTVSDDSNPEFLQDYRLEERNISRDYYPQETDKTSYESVGGPNGPLGVNNSYRPIQSETRFVPSESNYYPTTFSESRHQFVQPNKLDEYVARTRGEFKSNHNKFPILDVILFAIAGVILIYIMEQFVRLGMLLA